MLVDKKAPKINNQLRLFQNFSFGETSSAMSATSKKRSFVVLAYGI
jgi:hypothetical protein